MALPDIVAELGSDPTVLFREAGLAPDYFRDPENTLSFATVGGMFRRAVELTGSRQIGLITGRRATTSSLGVVGFLMKASPTVADALLALSKHLDVQDRAAVLTIEADSHLVALQYNVVTPRVDGIEQIYAFVVALGNSVMRELCGDEWRAAEVCFPFAPAGNAYRQAFEAPVRYNAERTSLVFATTWLSRPLDTADPLLHRMMTERIQQLEARWGTSTVERARQLLATMVLMPDCTAVLLASRMGMSERSLFRRLADEGASFQSLRDEACRNTAYELLANTSKRPADVSVVLGYSDASAFTRAFHRWSGMTPAAWKAAHSNPTAGTGFLP